MIPSHSEKFAVFDGKLRAILKLPLELPAKKFRQKAHVMSKWDRSHFISVYYVQRWGRRIRRATRLGLLSQNKWDKSSLVSPLLAWPTITLIYFCFGQNWCFIRGLQPFITFSAFLWFGTESSVCLLMYFTKKSIDLNLWPKDGVWTDLQ